MRFAVPMRPIEITSSTKEDLMHIRKLLRELRKQVSSGVRVALNSDGTLSVNTASLAKSDGYREQMRAGAVMVRRSRMSAKIAGATFVRSGTAASRAK